MALFLHSTENNFYNDLGQKSCAHSVTFDLYMGLSVNIDSIDLASLNKVVQQTGGDILYFSMFDPVKNCEKLYYEFFRNVSKTTATEV